MPSAERLAPWNRLKRLALYGAIALPPAYFVAVTQYSALTYPFWDHLELVRYIVACLDGNLRLQDLFQAQNDARPFTFRAVLVANAALTRWDIRSEYLYLVAVGLATWAIQLAILFRLAEGARSGVALWSAAAVSVLAFSPVGHATHWWSAMLQVTLANLLVVATVACIAFARDSWLRHGFAAALAWLAAYSFTHGILVLAMAAIVMQLSGRDPRKADPFAVFWLVNLVLLLVVYLDGLAPWSARGSGKPLDAVVFLLAYAGAPLAYLLRFPYESQFHIPVALAWPATVGAILLVLVAEALRSGWDNLRRAEPNAIVLYLFAGVGLGSAFASYLEAGGPQPTASRHAIFSACLVFGLVHWHASRHAPLSVVRVLAERARLRSWAALPMAAFLALSFATYREAIRVYAEARAFNQKLADAFGPGSPPGNTVVYPNAEAAARMRADLARLGLGPYRFLPQATVRLGSRNFARAVTLLPGESYRYRFRLPRPGLAGLDLQVVTFGRTPSSYPVHWRVLPAGSEVAAASGRLDAAGLRDWSEIQVRLDAPAPGTEFDLVVEAPAGPPIDAPIGLPLFHAEEGAAGPDANSTAVVPGLSVRHVGA